MESEMRMHILLTQKDPASQNNGARPHTQRPELSTQPPERMEIKTYAKVLADLLACLLACVEWPCMQQPGAGHVMYPEISSNKAW